MRMLELTLWGIVLLGVLFKVLHLPFASLLLMFGLSLLMMLYFLLGWLLFPRPSHKDQLVGFSVFCGFAFTLTLEGLMFKVQRWPHAEVFNVAGLVLTGAAIVLIVALKVGRPHLSGYFSGLLRRAVPLLVLGLLLLPVRETHILRFHHRNDPRAAALIDSLERTEDPGTRRDLYERLYRLPPQEPPDELH